MDPSSSSGKGIYTKSMTLLGIVSEIKGVVSGIKKVDEGWFTLHCRSGNDFEIHVRPTTDFAVVRNMDDLDRDRISNTPNYDLGQEKRLEQMGKSVKEQMDKYLKKEMLLSVAGVNYSGSKRVDARTITLLTEHHKTERNDKYVFEDTHWWLTQMTALADEWLDDLFGERRSIEWDDFAKLYRTNLGITGQKLNDNDVQECATLSRLIYGLSSCYLLTGRERYRLAAEAGVKYQRETFRSLSHNGRYCFWQFGKRKVDRGAEMIMASENDDDRGAIPLYEQIYALAGLCQYYRISQDWRVLADVERTINAFQRFYLDVEASEEAGKDDDSKYGCKGGYFSHIDYITLRPDAKELEKNPGQAHLKPWKSC